MFFELGFRLPMHPLFAALLKLLGCGVAQLSPNAVVQICGVIAQSHDVGKVLTVDLLLSIFMVKYTGVSSIWIRSRTRPGWLTSGLRTMGGMASGVIFLVGS